MARDPLASGNNPDPPGAHARQLSELSLAVPLLGFYKSGCAVVASAKGGVTTTGGGCCGVRPSVCDSYFSGWPCHNPTF